MLIYRLRRGFLCGLVAAMGLVALPVHAEVWMSADYSEVHVVVPPKAPPVLQEAIAAFCRYWDESTGNGVTQSPINQGRVNVWVDGEQAVAEGLLPEDEWRDLLPHEVLVRTYLPSARQARHGVGGHLLIIGRTPEDTALAMSVFLQKVLQVRWLTPSEVTSVRVPFTIDTFAYKEFPAFTYRGIDLYAKVYNPTETAWRRGHRLSQVNVPWKAPDDLSMRDPVLPLLASDFTGERPRYTLDDPAASDRLVREIADGLSRRPLDLDEKTLRQRGRLAWHGLGSDVEQDAVVVNLSGVDWVDFTVPDGANPTDAWLQFVNRVAAGLQAALPDTPVFVNTLAANACREAPETERPADNVVVTLTTLDCNLGRALNDPDTPENAAFVEDLAAWSRTGARLHMLDFLGNTEQPQRLLPVVMHLQTNLRLYARYGVRGVHFAMPRVSDPSHLALGAVQAYFGAQLLWDPDLLLGPALDDFLERYYGPAGRPLRDALETLTAAAEASETPVTPTGDIGWLDETSLAEAERSFHEAFAMALSEEQSRRLGVAHLPMRYAAARLAAGQEAPLPKALQLGLDQYAAALALYVAPENRARAQEVNAPLLREFTIVE